MKVVLKIEVGVKIKQSDGSSAHSKLGGESSGLETTRMVRLVRCAAVRVMLSSVYRAGIWTSMSVGRCWGVVMREESVVED